MNNDYQLYVSDTIKLAKTINIKSTDTCDAINNYLRIIGGDEAVDLSQPNTWKYYLNISGAYHSSDTPMTIVSWDTGETINFTLENLAIHKATKIAYEYGTQQYVDLLTQFPNQEMLILGILYPCDINLAIDAVDGTILTYPEDLIEDNEYSLVTKLNTWITGYKVRWTNSQYAITDELYTATQLGVMYLFLVPAIMMFRLEACKTNEAHSFHIKQYLVSRGISANVIRFMTKKQSLFFYRNLNYIRRNIGKADVFAWVVEHVLTERYFPLSSYRMRHSDTDLVDNLAPTIFFKKELVNTVYDADSSSHVTLPALLAKEVSLVAGNANYIADKQIKIQETFENSLSNVVLTKVLESAVVNYQDSGQYSLESILINHWVYLASSNYYNIYVHIENSKTGDSMALTAKEAFILYFYAYMKSMGFDPDTIPDIPAVFVQRVPRITKAEMMSVVDTKYVSSDIADFALSLSPKLDPVKSVIDFNALCYKIQIAARYHRHLPAYFQNRMARAQAQAMVSSIYTDKLCKLSLTTKTYESWLSDTHIDLSNYERTDYTLLYKSLLKAATGSDIINENSVSNIYNAMMSLMEQLTSYSVQFIRNSSSGDLINLNYIMMRFNKEGVLGKTHIKVDCNAARVQDLRVSAGNSFDVSSEVYFTGSDVRVKASKHVDIRLDTEFHLPGQFFKIKRHVFSNGTGVRSISISPV